MHKFLSTMYSCAWRRGDGRLLRKMCMPSTENKLNPIVLRFCLCPPQTTELPLCAVASRGSSSARQRMRFSPSCPSSIRPCRHMPGTSQELLSRMIPVARCLRHPSRNGASHSDSTGRASQKLAPGVNLHTPNH